ARAVSRAARRGDGPAGARLFDRMPPGVRPTRAGPCPLGHAETVLERMRAAQQDLEALRNLDAGRLRVGAFDSADAALVPRALASFRAAHPGVCLSVIEGNTTAQLGRLQDGEIDIAVVSAYPHQALDAGHLDLHHLLDDPLMVALPTGHRLARRRVLPPADLPRESGT